MEEKDVAGIGLAPGRLSGQQGDLAMGRGMLGEIVEHHHRMAATIPKILGHREARERRDPLQPRRRGGLATTKMVRSGAPCRRTWSTTRATAELFWPIAT